MDEALVRQQAEILVCEQFAKKGMFYVPVSSSNRHVHLCRADVDSLFGKGYELTKLRDLRQPNQFAANEQVTFKTKKGSVTLRVVGPIRPETQVELSASECVKLGVPVCVRMSGDTKNSPGGELSTGKGSVELKQGVIVAARHLHLTTDQGKLYGLKSGDSVRLFVEGQRGMVFENVIVRCGEAHALECHIDIEEANACQLPPNAICKIEKMRQERYLSPVAPIENAKRVYGNIVPNSEAPIFAMSGAINQKTQRGAMPEPAKKKMLTESDIIAASKAGQVFIELDKNTLLTPLARDRALQLGIELKDKR
ncbi:MAG: phosphate propanoyltransferase [Eubacteriales bacterium]|nr:phosphate propanoyltransferase [Eubacteriales bacterium]